MKSCYSCQSDNQESTLARENIVITYKTLLVSSTARPTVDR